eukprot:UN28252
MCTNWNANQFFVLEFCMLCDKSQYKFCMLCDKSNFTQRRFDHHLINRYTQYKFWFYWIDKYSDTKLRFLIPVRKCTNFIIKKNFHFRSFLD